MPSTQLLSVLSGDSSTASDYALCKFAEFLGLRTELVPLAKEPAVPPTALQPAPPGGRILALGCTTLRQVLQLDWFVKLLDESRFVFLYDFTPANGESPELKRLTGGALSAVASLAPGLQQFTIHSDVKHGRFPVSGKSYTAESGPTAVFSGTAPGSAIEVYITANGQPSLVSITRGQSILFLLAGAGLIDIDQALTPKSSLRPWYAQLIALSIFLRTAFGPWCWTSPVTGATFIVDDPQLKKRYGFVQYDQLVREVEQAQGALTIAFIPYNHRSSSPETVDLLLRHADRFSICVHGCDHTGGEFASLDERWLTGTTACALDRMANHTRLTGMPFDNVMVFPQGSFSTKAIRALHTCGFHAAVNTTAWPTDAGEDRLTIRDLLQVAVTRYEGFPIFVRRYPDDVFDYAFDALFQKPILAVGHHGDFRHGYAPLVELTRAISAFGEKVAWMPLGSTLASSCVLKLVGSNHYAVRHYTPRLRLKNPTAHELLLSIEKPETGDRARAVIVGGQSVPFEVRSGWLNYDAHVAPGQELIVEVQYHPSPRTTRETSFQYKVKTATRRILSDARDNYLARSTVLLGMAERTKRLVFR